MDQEKKENPQQEVEDQKLEQVAGGAKDENHGYVRDKKGRIIGEGTWDGSWSFVYWPCPKCGKPMHLGTLNWYYCDPCDYKKFSMRYHIWFGDEAGLIAAAD